MKTNGTIEPIYEIAGPGVAEKKLRLTPCPVCNMTKHLSTYLCKITEKSGAKRLAVGISCRKCEIGICRDVTRKTAKKDYSDMLEEWNTRSWIPQAVADIIKSRATNRVEKIRMQQGVKK